MYLDKYPITSGYRTSSRPDHNGVDIAVPTGTPLPALVDGTIAFEGFIAAAASGYRPEVIVILQSSGYFVVYGHLSRTLVNIGQRVKAGDTIGYSGNTGYVLPKPRDNNDLVSGSHLHIEKRVGTKASSKPLSAYTPQDITPLLQAYGTTGGTMDNKMMDTRLFAEIVVNAVMDKVEGKPDYFTRQRPAWDGHVNRLLNAKVPDSEVRKFLGEVMASNGVLSAPQMKQYQKEVEGRIAQLSKQTENMTIVIDGLEAQARSNQDKLDTQDELVGTLISENKVQEQAIRDQLEQLISHRETIRLLTEANDKLKAAAKTSDPITALSGIELIRLGLRKWLGMEVNN